MPKTSKVCKQCGKKFVVGIKRSSFCCEKCKEEYKDNIATISKHLCWKCEKVTKSGCSWSKKLIPVKGWSADVRIVHDGPRYTVTDCPEFVRG